MELTETGRLLSGRYRLGTVVGRGGMGVVWQARDELLKRDVAVKELIWPPHLTEAEQQTACRRTVREAQMAGRLAHLNVVRIYDILEEDDHPWIIMELLPYPSLRDLVREEGPLAPARAARVGLGVVAALRAAHAEGVLHRDVKPANILVAPDGRVVLTDFGIARAVDSPTLTNAGGLIGSPSYIAPERARGGQSRPAGDLWALGASLYAAVEGHPPFERNAALATLTAVVIDEPAQAAHAGPLWPVISGLLRKDPDERLDAAETERLLREVADHDEAVAAGSASRRARPAFWRVRSASRGVPPVLQAAAATEQRAESSAGTAPVAVPEAAVTEAAVLGSAVPEAAVPEAEEAAAAGESARAEGAADDPAAAVAGASVALGAAVAALEADRIAPLEADRIAPTEADGIAPPESVAVSAPGLAEAPVTAADTASSSGQPPSAADPAAAPAARRPRRSRRPAIALAALIAVAAGAVALALTLTSSPGGTAASSGARSPSAGHQAKSSGAPTPGASTTTSAGAPGSTASANPSASAASAPASGPASPTGSPGSGDAGYGALPAGYYRFTNSTGFSIGVPDGWQIQHVGHYVYIIDPSNAGIFLLIDQSDTPQPNPLLNWEQQAANRASTYQDYHLVRLDSVYYPQAEKAADWEFTYVRDGILVHILNRNVLANAHHAYALYWSAPESDWSASYHYFQAFAATFRPAQ
jgi:hypothetical protein